MRIFESLLQVNLKYIIIKAPDVVESGAEVLKSVETFWQQLTTGAGHSDVRLAPSDAAYAVMFGLRRVMLLTQ